MSSNIHIDFSDEMFHFLYSSKVFQSLSEKEQMDFIRRYCTNEEFKSILQVAMDLNEVIKEVEQYVPNLTEEVIRYFKKPRHSISNRVIIEDNVYHYPFGEVVKEQGPLIVCLQQGDSMIADNVVCKGMILPLFDLCYREKRDLIILPFGSNFMEFQFEYGTKPLSQFDQFIQSYLSGEAKFQPVLNRVKILVEQADVLEQSEVIIVSNHLLEDYDAESLEKLAHDVKCQGVTISCIALDEHQFDQQPMHFLDKIYFAGE